MQGSSKVVTGWIALAIATSLIAHASGWLVGVLAFEPDRVLRGELWRLVTWIFVEETVTRTVVTGLLVHRFCGGLAARWGDRALLRYLLVVLVGAALATTLLAVVLPAVHSTVTIGGWSIRCAIVIAWAREFPDDRLTMLDIPFMTGRRAIPFIVAAVAMFALGNGLFTLLPEVLTCLAACCYPRDPAEATAV